MNKKLVDFREGRKSEVSWVKLDNLGLLFTISKLKGVRLIFDGFLLFLLSLLEAINC